MSKVLPPFTCTYTPNIPELLNQLGITLVLSTYQAGKVIFVNASNSETLTQLPRNFDKAMGIAVDGDKLAIASKSEISVFRCDRSLAKDYPDQPNTYETIYAPKATYYTGAIDAHDLIYSKLGLLAVNTMFSCLVTIDDDYSFKPFWKPNFISEIAPGDRCHLNGVALLNGMPEYVTMLGVSDEPQGWRAKKSVGGAIMHVPTNKIILDKLSMPHSPRIYGDKLFFLNSGKGEIVSFNPTTGVSEVVKSLPYFLRGMALHEDYLFVGLSKIRSTSTSFQQLPISETATVAGIAIIYLPFKSLLGVIKYENSVEEIFDVQVILNKKPGIMSMQKDSFKNCVVLENESYWVLPKQ